jgi:hypothetical protein
MARKMTPEEETKASDGFYERAWNAVMPSPTAT